MCNFYVLKHMQALLYEEATGRRCSHEHSWQVPLGPPNKLKAKRIADAIIYHHVIYWQNLNRRR